MADLQYENEIRAIRGGSAVFSSPEIREFILNNNSNGSSFTILDVNPINSPVVEQLTEYTMRRFEELNQMRMNWRDRIRIYFSNQNPDMQPIPLWSEVPTRPSEPWAIEEWEKDNLVRSYWANRLNGGYIQTNIIIRDSPYDNLQDYTESTLNDYYSLDWFDNGYQFIENDLNIDVFE